jgi:hypothetical protein
VTALPGELRPRPQAGRLRVLLLPRDDVEGLVQMPCVAERISQMPGDQPRERVVARGVGAAETVFQKVAGLDLIRGLRDERQCRAHRWGSGETGDLPQLGQVAGFAARRQGAMPYRVAEQCCRAVSVPATRQVRQGGERRPGPVAGLVGGLPPVGPEFAVGGITHVGWGLAPDRGRYNRMQQAVWATLIVVVPGQHGGGQRVQEGPRTGRGSGPAQPPP